MLSVGLKKICDTVDVLITISLDHWAWGVRDLSTVDELFRQNLVFVDLNVFNYEYLSTCVLNE